MASDGVELLLDIRAICEGAELGDTFAFTDEFFNYESYVVFRGEMIRNITLALLAVFVIVFVTTANLPVAWLVLLCVALVDLFLLALLATWDLTLNSITIVNLVIAIGLAVDYSAHIAKAYLMVEPPEVSAETGAMMTNAEKRVYKARGALGAMGSSVFHGALSTFLAIIVLSSSQSYIFQAFFRMWVGIILFGVANGFILLPVLLSFCGPLPISSCVSTFESDSHQLSKGRDPPSTEMAERRREKA
jgi:Niemann-Pick C1 protein